MSIVKKRRNAVDQNERRERIAKLAARMFRERGLQNVSMNDIAQASDLAKPVLYRAFESREALEAAIFEPIIKLFERAPDYPFEGAGSQTFALFKLLQKQQDAALLILRDCRTSPQHAHWYETFRDNVTERVRLAFKPEPKAPRGANQRADTAARWMTSLYLETLAGWLEDIDGLNDDQRRAWFRDVVDAWWTAARREYRLEAK